MNSRTGLRWRLEGAGRDLVLVHGWALTLDYWDTVVPLLTQRYRVLRFDRRGFGGSIGMPSLDGDCTDLLRLMEEAGMQRAAVLGMSQGARIAVAAALADPARVSALVLDGPPMLGNAAPAAAAGEEPEVPLQQLHAIWRREGDLALQRAVAGLPLMQLVDTSPQARDALDRCIAAYRGADLVDVLPSHVEPVEALQLPVLVLNGERESAQRLQAGLQLSEQIADCRRSVIENAGHLAALDSPARHAAVVADFLAS